MRIATICPTCATFINSVCVIYDGEYLANIDVAPGDTLEEILAKINSSCACSGTSTTTSTSTTSSTSTTTSSTSTTTTSTTTATPTTTTTSTTVAPTTTTTSTSSTSTTSTTTTRPTTTTTTTTIPPTTTTTTTVPPTTTTTTTASLIVCENWEILNGAFVNIIDYQDCLGNPQQLNLDPSEIVGCFSVNSNAFGVDIPFLGAQPFTFNRCTPTTTTTTTTEFIAYNYYTFTPCSGGAGVDYRSILALGLGEVYAFTSSPPQAACYTITSITAAPNTNDLPTLFGPKTDCSDSDCVQV